MGKRLENQIGLKYNRLLLNKELEPHIYPNGKSRRRFECICDCGKITEVLFSDLRNGNTKSCGCWNLESSSISGTNSIKHGDSYSTSEYHYLYNTWDGIKKRCLKEYNHNYKNYGGRGIIMYEPWINNYQDFKKWILNNLGERPEGYSIDRIDNNKGYLPGNLRWADRTTQSKNRRNGKSNV